VILSRYVFWLTLTRILGALAVLVGVLQILDLLEVTTKIIDRNLGMAGIVHYAMLRLPRIFEQSASIGVLAGALFAFAQLARESAVVAMRSTGISTYRIIGMAAPAGLLILAIHMAVLAWIAPHTDQLLEAWWRDTTPAAERTPTGVKTFRVGADIVVATAGEGSGRTLKAVTIYHRTPQGRLDQQTSAPQAVYDGKGVWTLQAPRFVMVGATVMESSATEMLWRTPLRPSDVRTLYWGEGPVAVAASRRALAGGASVRPQAYYETQLQRAWAEPMAIMVMLLLAAPVALANFRSGRGPMVLTLCLGTGLLFLVIDGVLTAVGQSGVAPAVLASWAAPVIFAAGAGTILLFMEG
jgi:lipopolysaccharide export system permease protein